MDAYTKEKRKSKLDVKSIGILVGYSSASKGYRIFNLEKRTVDVARNVQFNETMLGSANNLTYENDSLLEDDDDESDSADDATPTGASQPVLIHYGTAGPPESQRVNPDTMDVDPLATVQRSSGESLSVDIPSVPANDVPASREEPMTIDATDVDANVEVSPQTGTIVPYSHGVIRSRADRSPEGSDGEESNTIVVKRTRRLPGEELIVNQTGNGEQNWRPLEPGMILQGEMAL
ncbi:hypothetical protein V1525DRAFT_412636 [Lipomyces kononenkoae]|uniref:Uncharacterized protein n=1 Tax=Lipomyces kononenkoae TaxID=34357 RepID=A0ACC3SSI5_LIPKO